MAKVLAALGVLVAVAAMVLSAIVVFGAAAGHQVSLGGGGGDGGRPTTVTTRAPFVYEITIPKGAAEQVKRGQRPVPMPPFIYLRVGDSIRFTNLDEVAQSLGPFNARPGETIVHTFTEPIRTKGACTFEPGGMPVVIVVEPAEGAAGT